MQHDYPCIQCGALLSYAPGTTYLKCEYCGEQNRIEQTLETVVETDYVDALKSLPESRENAVSLAVKCETCAAEFEFDANVHADECPFCGTRIVVETHEHRHIQPAGLLPFKIDAKQATASYRRWLKGLWFAPGKLKKYAREENTLNGIYVPYWTYDCHTYTRYRGQRGTAYQVPVSVTEVVNGRRVQRTRYVTKIRWNNVSGTVSRDFDDVLVFAGKSLPRSLARELAPWDIENIIPYREEYLSGFRSEIYSVDIKDGFAVAQELMKPTLQSDVRSDIGGDRQRIQSMDTHYSETHYKHILLPFWSAGFRFRKKSYKILVNGRTGEVQGERPYSMIKILFAAITALILVIVAFSYFSTVEQGYDFSGFVLPDLVFPH